MNIKLKDTTQTTPPVVDDMFLTRDNVTLPVYDSIKDVSNFSRKPDVLYSYESGMTKIKGINANIAQTLTWSLTNMDFSPYKRLKFYITPGISSNMTTPNIVLEMSLDSMAQNSDTYGHYTASGIYQYLNDNNRLCAICVAVSSDKTSMCILKQYSLYGTAATSAVDDTRYLYKIEGYYD